MDQDIPLRLQVRVLDVNLHEESIELGFRQRIDAFLLERVLGR